MTTFEALELLRTYGLDLANSTWGRNAILMENEVMNAYNIVLAALEGKSE